jgi:hypothetical protein
MHSRLGLVLALVTALVVTLGPVSAAQAVAVSSSAASYSASQQDGPNLSSRRATSKNPDQDILLTFGWGIYLNLFGYELRNVAWEIVALGGVGAIAGCAGIGGPGPVAVAVRVICTAVGSATMFDVLRLILRIWRNNDIVNSACYQIKIVPFSGQWARVNAKNCLLGA